MTPCRAADDPTTAGTGAGDAQCTDDSLANWTSCFRDARERRSNHPHLAPSVVGRGTRDALRRAPDAVPVYGYPLVETVLYEHPQLVGSIGLKEDPTRVESLHGTFAAISRASPVPPEAGSGRV